MSEIGQVVLQAHGLGKRFEDGQLNVQVLHDVSIAVHAGETLAIVGASGSGKSTLLHLLGGLDAPSTGRVQLLGQDLQRLSAREQGQWRNQHLGFIYQFHHLLPEFTALENVAMPLLIRRLPREQALQQAAAMLAAVGLAERTAHKPAQLSGGERQRVAIARALVTQPALILADEPTGALDSQTSEDTMALLAQLNAQGITVVLVTHEHDVAAWARRCIVLRDGAIVQDQAQPGHAQQAATSAALPQGRA